MQPAGLRIRRSHPSPMNLDYRWLHRQVELTLDGFVLQGRFCELGTDLLVLYRPELSRYAYIPLIQLKGLRLLESVPAPCWIPSLPIPIMSRPKS